MKTFKPCGLVVALLTSTFQVAAHSGHDHNHWSSGILHFLMYMSLVAVAAGLTIAVAKTAIKTSNKKKESGTNDPYIAE